MPHSPFIRYTMAVVAVAICLSAKSAIDRWIGIGPPLMFFVPAVTFVAWRGGLGPGLFATALSQAVCILLYMNPAMSFWVEAPNDRVRLCVFGIDGILTSVFMGQLIAARRHSEAKTLEAESYRETLFQSEQRLQSMIDNTTAIVYLKDPYGRYLLVNRSFEHILGSSGKGVIGKSDRDFFPSEVAETFETQDREILQSGSAKEWEDTLALADGTHTYLTIKFPLFDSVGIPYAVGGFSADITGRKKAELALRASEERFRSLSSCSPVGIYQTDARGHCTYTNPRCQEIYGFDFSEGLGEGWTHYIHPEDRSEVVTNWNNAASAGTSLAVIYRTLSPQGQVRWVDDRTAPVMTDRNEVIGFVGTVEDITDRKNAEDAIKRERDFAERLIKAAQAIVLVLDSHGRIVRFNPFLEHALGCSSDEIQDADWFSKFVNKRDQALARAAFKHALTEVGGSHVIHPIPVATGLQREVEWSHQSLAGVVGEAPGVLVIGHDVTDLKEAQRRAVQAERLAAIGQMAAGLAHEGRNAIQRGQACLEMLALRLNDRPDALDLVAGVQQAQDDLHRLYEEVRGYASPILLNRQVCGLPDLFQGAWERLEPIRKGRVIHLGIQGRPEEECEGDPFRLIQVFRNVLDNAIAASDDPVEIEVDWTDTKLEGRPSLLVTISDNGPGLTADQRHNLFEPFYTTKIQGTGLGMAITRRIVEAHGGVIIACPHTVHGAKIQITLPRVCS